MYNMRANGRCFPSCLLIEGFYCCIVDEISFGFSWTDEIHCCSLNVQNLNNFTPNAALLLYPKFGRKKWLLWQFLCKSGGINKNEFNYNQYSRILKNSILTTKCLNDQLAFFCSSDKCTVAMRIWMIKNCTFCKCNDDKIHLFRFLHWL